VILIPGSHPGAGSSKGLGLVVFYDGGNVFPAVDFTISRRCTRTTWAWVSYADTSRPGTHRWDITQPNSGSKSTQYFVSIGQAF